MDSADIVPDLLKLAYPVVLAPTGMIPMKSHTQHVPVTPAEVARDVAEAVSMGITSVHLHARNADGTPGWQRDAYARLIDAVRSVAPDVVINVSTSGRSWSELERRADCLALVGDHKPDMASLTTSSLNFLSGASVNEPEVVRGLARIMRDRGIVPEFEVFDLGMVNMIHVLRKEAVVAGPPCVNVFLGNIAGAQATPSALAAMTAALPDGSIWCGAGIGDHRATAHALALAGGGGVRVGLEDGIYLDRSRTVLARNADLVARAHEQGRMLDRRPMTPGEFRMVAGLPALA